DELIDEIFNKIENSKSTMRKLVIDVKNTFSINNEHTNQLKNVLEKRNYFANKFFKVNSFKPYTETGQKEMILECANFIDDCKKIDIFLTEYYHVYYLKIGLTEEVVTKTFLRVRQEEYNQERTS